MSLDLVFCGTPPFAVPTLEHLVDAGFRIHLVVTQPDRPKGRTKIGRNVHTGIHNGFEAPVEVGDDAWIAGGSYITEDVPPESLAGFPPKQITKEGYLRGKRND